MSFKAKLFIENEERNVLNAHLLYHRFSDLNGKPTSKTIGGPLSFNIESTGNDSLFYENMFSPSLQCQGEIIFYKRDGLSTLFKIEFANAHIIALEERFKSSGIEPLHMVITIGWGIIKVRGIVYEEYWNPNNPFVEQAAATKIGEEEVEGKLIDYYLTDLNNNKIEKSKVGEKVQLNIRTKNLLGELLDISLTDHTADFKYNGKLLENDVLKDYEITNDLEKIELEVVKQQA